MKKKSLDQNISMFQSAELNRITRLHKRYEIHILDQQCVCMTTEFIYTAIQQQQNKKYRTQREKRAVTEFGSSFFSHLFILCMCVIILLWILASVSVLSNAKHSYIENIIVVIIRFLFSFIQYLVIHDIHHSSIIFNHRFFSDKTKYFQQVYYLNIIVIQYIILIKDKIAINCKPTISSI